jgi:voltage-gated potassium channel
MSRFYNDAERVLGSPARNLVSMLGFTAMVAVLATIGFMAAGWSFADASYMVVLTIYSVGYGEVRPIDTPYLHAVTMATMVLGCTGMILVTGALVQLFTVLQIRQFLGASRMHSRIEKLSGHVIVCGYGRIGLMLAQELSRAGMPLVILERSPERIAEAEAAGYLCLVSDATEEDALEHAGISRARVLATVLPDDAANVFITLSARNLNPALEIIARGEAPTTERKLLRAGADHVVLPTHIGAERIARMILYPASTDIADDSRLAPAQRELEQLGLELEKVSAIEGAAMCGLTVAEAERRAAGTMFVVQINRGQEKRMVRPAPDERIEAGDEVMIVVRDTALAARALFTNKEKIQIGRNRF